MVDHLVYATPDVEQSVAELEARLGVRASPGGQHLGLGTYNALLALGEACYLEIVGPDPLQRAIGASRVEVFLRGVVSPRGTGRKRRAWENPKRAVNGPARTRCLHIELRSDNQFSHDVAV